MHYWIFFLFILLTYRNYVVQHLLGMKMQKVTKDLLRRFQGRFVSLSCNKYASNVVEKLLQSGEEVSAAIIIELLRSPNASMLLVDPFGNFVIQNALSAAKVRYPTSVLLGNSNIDNSTLCFDDFLCFRFATGVGIYYSGLTITWLSYFILIIRISPILYTFQLDITQASYHKL